MDNINIESYYRDYAYTLESTIDNDTNLYDYIKRVFDIILSILGITIGLPIILVFSILIIIESPGTPFYTQERVGKNGKHFTIFKLRSMYKDSEKNGATWASQADPRITKVGAFIRKSRIDEIPQIINILKDDMSIVGPRPERPNFTFEFNEEIPGFIHRLQVKPGLTGWAQINGGYEMTPKEKLQADMYYIEKRSLLLDFRIVLKTVVVVISGEGAR